MALARLALKNLQQRVISPSSTSILSSKIFNRSVDGNHHWDSEMIIRNISSETAVSEKEKKDEKSAEGREISVSEEDSRKKSKLFPSLRRKRRGNGLWRKDAKELGRFDLNYLFPSGLGDALLQASENINKLFENLTPSRFLGLMKEKDDCYKLRLEVPGLSKEEINITIVDGILIIKGEHKEEEGDSSDDEHWSSYGYYNTSIVLPDDAKVDEIKAEMKDGVLSIIIPRSEEKKKEVKEVKIN